MKLAGKVAIVTGAGSGMGRAIARAYAEEGCIVVAIGRTAAKLEGTASGGAGTIEPYAADVGERDQAFAAVKATLDKHRRIDILVNNAGVNVRERTLDVLTPENFDKMIRINLNGAYHMTQAVLPTMREQKVGRIINVGSIAGLRPSVLGGSGYSASKAAMHAFSAVVAMEEAKHGICSSVIAPGEVNTPILDDRPTPVPQEKREAMLQPVDIAAAALFIALLPPRAHVPELVITPTGYPFA